jgi:ATP-dependent DNA helicase RecG
LFASSHNGFDLAEADLKRRGPGALIGKRQSGLSDTAMLALQNKKLIQVARKSASELIAQDPELKNYPDLANYVADIRAQLHLE